MLIGVATVAGCNGKPAVVNGRSTGTVDISIVVDGETRFSIHELEVVDGTSLETVMRSTDKCPIEISGRGSTAFVKSIDGIKNGGSKGWTFKVDGEFAQRGIGHTSLHPPTKIEWSYGEFEM